MMCDQIIDPFFFTEQSISANIYSVSLTKYVVTCLHELQPDVVFQKDGAPPDWGLKVLAYYLDKQFTFRSDG